MDKLLTKGQCCVKYYEELALYFEQMSSMVLYLIWASFVRTRLDSMKKQSSGYYLSLPFKNGIT